MGWMCLSSAQASAKQPRLEMEALLEVACCVGFYESDSGLSSAINMNGGYSSYSNCAFLACARALTCGCPPECLDITDTGVLVCFLIGKLPRYFIKLPASRRILNIILRF